MLTREQLMRSLGWFSQSKRDQYAQCPRRFYYREIERLESKERPTYLTRGGLIAKGFEALRKGEDLKKTIDAYEVSEYESGLKDLAYSVISRSQERVHEEGWRTQYLDGEPLVEWKMRIPLVSGRWKGIQGTADWIPTDVEGRTWLWDDKSRKGRIMPYGHDRRQTQAPLYQYMLDYLHGIHTLGSVTHQVLADLENEPKTKKNGALSRGQARCSKRTYLRVLRSTSSKQEDYQDIIDQLPHSLDRIDRYVRRPEEINAVFRSMLQWMGRIEADRHFTPVETPDNCTRCSYRQLCDAERCGTQDADYIRKDKYVIKEEEE